MKQVKTIGIKILLAYAMLIAVSVFLDSCKSCFRPGVTDNPFDITLTATIKELWTGTSKVAANDSLIWNSGVSTITKYTNDKGDVAAFTYKYVAGNPFTLSACSNGEIMQKIANKAYTSGTDPLLNATYSITALGGPPYAIPVKIICTDLAGNPHVGDNVQFSNSAGPWGAGATTQAGGIIMYPIGLLQGTTYTLKATGTASSASLSISTSPPPGALGVLNGSPYQFSGIEIYMRY